MFVQEDCESCNVQLDSLIQEHCPHLLTKQGSITQATSLVNSQVVDAQTEAEHTPAASSDDSKILEDMALSKKLVYTTDLVYSIRQVVKTNDELRQVFKARLLELGIDSESTTFCRPIIVFPSRKEKEKAKKKPVVNNLNTAKEAPKPFVPAWRIPATTLASAANLEDQVDIPDWALIAAQQLSTHHHIAQLCQLIVEVERKDTSRFGPGLSTTFEQGLAKKAATFLNKFGVVQGDTCNLGMIRFVAGLYSHGLLAPATVDGCVRQLMDRFKTTKNEASISKMVQLIRYIGPTCYASNQQQHSSQPIEQQWISSATSEQITDHVVCHALQYLTSNQHLLTQHLSDQINKLRKPGGSAWQACKSNNTVEDVHAAMSDSKQAVEPKEKIKKDPEEWPTIGSGADKCRKKNSMPIPKDPSEDEQELDDSVDIGQESQSTSHSSNTIDNGGRAYRLLKTILIIHKLDPYSAATSVKAIKFLRGETQVDLASLDFAEKQLYGCAKGNMPNGPTYHMLHWLYSNHYLLATGHRNERSPASFLYSRHLKLSQKAYKWLENGPKELWMDFSTLNAKKGSAGKLDKQRNTSIADWIPDSKTRSDEQNQDFSEEEDQASASALSDDLNAMNFETEVEEGEDDNVLIDVAEEMKKYEKERRLPA
uniref:Uncharacterized protein n=1 Tax=Ditylenchus dipsaci TaxID=166011 RepID=A0A915CS20_9BILA